eukprot:gene17262-23581_t
MLLSDAEKGNIIGEHLASKRIQRAWRRAVLDPEYKACKKRLMREFDEMNRRDAWVDADDIFSDDLTPYVAEDIHVFGLFTCVCPSRIIDGRWFIHIEEGRFEALLVS